MENYYEQYLSGFNAMIDGQQKMIQQSLEMGKLIQEAFISGEGQSKSDYSQLQSKLTKKYVDMGKIVENTTQKLFDFEEHLGSLTDAQQSMTKRLMEHGKSTQEMIFGFYEDYLDELKQKTSEESKEK
ncbi:MAG: hypothetical protein COB67_03360 [SAR324 cluster bacterium]|uniref:Phasin domain-containing protein n=1 Tax=SAR324 cluster bacterium TaxID=2024889 RepID=A0A2A4T9Z0_9DELT|nr:MAG: hypothetical protein COB67_03360 [SAR324 cluster bacterium]